MSEHIAVLKIALRHHMPKGQDDEPNGDAAEQEPKLPTSRLRVLRVKGHLHVYLSIPDIWGFEKGQAAIQNLTR